MTPLLLLIQLTLEAFQNVERIPEPGFGQCLGGRGGPITTAAQQQHDVLTADLGFQLTDEPRIPLQRGPGQEGNVNAIRNTPYELPLLGRANIHKHGGVRRRQIPSLLGRHASGKTRFRGRCPLASARQYQLYCIRFRIQSAIGNWGNDERTGTSNSQ
jgi:hypothetical protein